MKKWMKKIIVLMLACAMVIPTLTACGGGKKDEPIVLTVYSQLANFSGEQLGWSAQILKEKWNVVMNIVPESGGVYETRMEAGNLGDIILFGSDGGDYQRAVQAGMLYDWEADNLLHEYGPYIEEHMANALQKNKEMNGGTLYGFGHNVATSANDHEAFFYTWDLRWDLYKELGYPQYNTLDEFVDVLAQMKDICPTDDNGNETYAVSLWPDWDGNMVMYVKAMATAYYGYDEFQLGLYDCDTGTFHGALEENGPYLNCLRFFNQLNQKGLLDPNSMTQTYDEMSEKVQAGGTFFSIFDYSGNLLYNEKHADQNKMMLPWKPGDAAPIAYGLSTLGGNRVWGIGANTEYPEICMEIINWFCTPEGTMTYNYGPQGLCWDYDENGEPYFTEFGEKAYFDKETEMTGDYEGTGTFNDGTFQFNNTTWTINAENLDTPNGTKYNYQYWKSYQQPAKNDTEQDWRDYTGCTSVQEYLNGGAYKVAPGTAYQEAEMDNDMETTWNLVKDVIVTYSWRAIYAANDEEYEQIVQEMIDQANAYGYADCMTWSEEQAAIRHQCELDVMQ